MAPPLDTPLHQIITLIRLISSLLIPPLGSRPIGSCCTTTHESAGHHQSNIKQKIYQTFDQASLFAQISHPSPDVLPAELSMLLLLLLLHLYNINHI
jgi:hypothetical protein